MENQDVTESNAEVLISDESERKEMMDRILQRRQPNLPPSVRNLSNQYGRYDINYQYICQAFHQPS